MECHASLLVVLIGSVTVSSGFRTPVQHPTSYFEDVTFDEGNTGKKLLLQLSLLEITTHKNFAVGVPAINHEDDKLEKINHLLTELLITPWPPGTSPSIYIKDNSVSEAEEPYPNLDRSLNSSPRKRSRIYRKYPWKRQNPRYDPGDRFLCTPSKEDVFRLLLALHEARQGKRDRVVNFCNRKRPARSVFTNIHFVGK
ncbi:hypothetical protein NQ315_005483 [Exocentrus adspersus]|uniref:Uncharacterized protein n=1 Tax=Exocentrus adspersus TaxID=1586481 RepID=A0AAV8VU63_9CUCU|nr:hypothetical protein NQ315_005483 [Exocentrus adspersus]